jgi:transcriptional regulator with GAF, ATPase, and Fis domain
MPLEPFTPPPVSRGSVTTEQVGFARESPAASSPPALVVVASIDASQVGTRWALPHDQVTLIGREVATTGLNLRDAGVSRLHARCSWDSRRQGVLLTDAQSRNGTFVETQPIREALLQHGAVIRVGHSLLVYCEGDALELTRQRASQVARSTLTVLLRGETGTGKERFARMIHDASGREGPFVAINCASLPKELVSSELFGHTKTAFSGATQARKGLFMAAETGSLLLDEIGDCPPEVQLALLRVLQEKAVRPVGAEREVPINVRVLAATHQDLEQAVQAGTFRADLYARLREASLLVPPLRERKSELLLLAKNFAREAGAELTWTVDAAEALLAWSWPFNVRELQSLVRTFIATRQREGALDLAYLSQNHPDIAQTILRREQNPSGSTSVSAAPSAPPANKNNRQRIRDLLQRHDGNVSKVASDIGKPRAQVYRWMRLMGLSAESFRAPRQPL